MKMIINVILHRFCELIRQHCLIFTRYRNLCEPKTIKSQSIDDQIHSHRTWQLCDDSILIGQFVFMETCTQFPKMYLHLRITCINSNSKKEHALKCPNNLAVSFLHKRSDEIWDSFKPFIQKTTFFSKNTNNHILQIY